MACSLQGGSGSRNASPALVLRPPWPPRRCESGASSRLQCRAARKPRAASCLAAAQRMATTDNRPQASTSKGAASSKRKSTPQCHTQRAASALNIKAASQGGPRINHPPRSLHWAYTATPGGDHLHSNSQSPIPSRFCGPCNARRELPVRPLPALEIAQGRLGTTPKQTRTTRASKRQNLRRGGTT